MNCHSGSNKLLLLLILLCSQVHSRNIFRIVDKDSEAKQIRVDLIRGAEEEVLASYFILTDDITSTAGLALVARQAKQGKRVKLLMDASFAKISEARRAYLESCGVEIRYFHPFSISRPLQIFRRMHDKLLIVDGKHLLTGGRNIQNSYYGHDSKNYIDRDVYVEGPASARARAYFLTLFESSHVKKPKKAHAQVHELMIVEQEFERALDEVTRNGAISLGEITDWGAGEPETGEIQFLHSGFRRDGTLAPLVADALVALAESAKESIIIESPYFVPTPRLERVLEEAISRGVKVRILTNSIASTDGLLAVAGYELSKRKMVRMGVEVWECIGPDVLHAKSAVIDREIAIIGSYNLDPRSATLNTEVGVVVRDLLKAAELLYSFDGHLHDAYRIDAQGRPIAPPRPLIEIGYVKSKKVSCLKALVRLFPHLRQQL